MTQNCFRLTKRQQKLNDLLGCDATNIMAFGGSRSGKTFGLLRAIITRALAYESRHACLRYRFNHIKASIIYDTLPKMVQLCFPGVWERCKLDKTDWFLKLPNGSELWFGGLDDKERTEKILGQEYATIFFNESSQIPWASKEMALTRLAQQTPLRLKAYYDCNPPSKAHWAYKEFVEKTSFERKTALKNPEDYASIQMNPGDNRDNLPSKYFEILENMSERNRRRFLLGQFADATNGELWTYALCDQQRIVNGDIPEMQRIIVAVDPSGCSGEEDERSDEIGIVVVGLGEDGRGYVIEDLSGKFGPNGWAEVVSSAYERYKADRVVAETNFGGAMVEAVIRAAAPEIPFKEVKASRGKIARAEPIATLFERNKVSLAGKFEELEEQLCAMTMSGYTGPESPDRADAMIWGLSELFPAVTKPKESSQPTPKVIMNRQRARR